MKPMPTASQDAVAQLQTQIVHLEDAHGLLDSAVAAAMRNSKPVYISVCCNLAGEVHPAFAGESWLQTSAVSMLAASHHSRCILSNAVLALMPESFNR